MLAYFVSIFYYFVRYHATEKTQNLSNSNLTVFNGANYCLDAIKLAKKENEKIIEYNFRD